MSDTTEDRRLLELIAARTEYLVQHVLDGNEHGRRLAEELQRIRVTLEAHMQAEDARFERLETAVARLGGANGEAA